MIIERYEPEPLLSNVVRAGDFVITAGCIADDATQDVKSQTRQALADLDKYLKLCGSGRDRLVFVQIYLRDIRTRDAMNEAWLEWVDPKSMPARACVEARLANPDWLVEICATAVR